MWKASRTGVHKTERISIAITHEVCKMSQYQVTITRDPANYRCYFQSAALALALAVPAATIAQDEGMVVDELGRVGIGTVSPARLLHVEGNNAVFRMDRSVDTAAFLLIRTNSSGNPLKAFVVGANASGPNTGEFIINDIGATTGGLGQRRLTITNDGEAHFTGMVVAPEFAQTSSARFKEQIEPLASGREKIAALQPVSFVWKDTGEESLGLVAEEVAEILPSAVSYDESNLVSSVNYSGVVAVLIQAVKEQQQQIDNQAEMLVEYRNQLANNTAVMDEMRQNLHRVEAIVNRLPDSATGELALKTALSN